MSLVESPCSHEGVAAATDPTFLQQSLFSETFCHGSPLGLAGAGGGQQRPDNDAWVPAATLHKGPPALARGIPTIFPKERRIGDRIRSGQTSGLYLA